MTTVLIAAALLTLASSAAAAECIKTPAGRTVCRNAAGEFVAAPPAAAAGAVVVAPGAAVPRAAVAAPAYSRDVTTAETPSGRAAYNPRTGNAAASHTNANGVTTTETSRGGEAKTKNGMGVAHGAGGTTCAKGRGEAKCN